MKMFETPELDIQKFTVEDVITASGGKGDNETGEDEF